MERRPVNREPSIVPRDLSIMRELYDNRFMTTKQLEMLFGPHVGERLPVLFDAGYIDKPEAQWVWRRREGGGSKPLVYALANRGAQALLAFGLIEGHLHDWSENNRRLTANPLFMPHELSLTDVRVAYKAACLRRPDLQLIEGDELGLGKKVHALAIPGRKRRRTPDWIFALLRGDHPRAEGALCVVERDRSTEPNERFASPWLSNLKAKFEDYLAYARAQRQLTLFGIPGLRVLTIVEGGTEKVRHVAALAYEVSGSVGPNRFLTTSWQSFEGRDALSVPWLNSAGEMVTLEV
jgi:hypothetical protein